MTEFRLQAGDLHRFVLFLAAGALNTCFGYAVFACFIWIGLGNDLAVILGTVAGIAFNFQTIGKVFASRGFSRLPQFLLIYGLLLPTNVLLLRALVAAGLGPYIGEAVVIAIISPLSFLMMRRFVFVPTTEPGP